MHHSPKKDKNVIFIFLNLWISRHIKNFKTTFSNITNDSQKLSSHQKVVNKLPVTKTALSDVHPPEFIDLRELPQIYDEQV